MTAIHDWHALDPDDVVFVAMDFQNDFAHPDGTYGRNGFPHVPEAAATILPSVIHAWQAARAHRIPVVAVGLTILEDLEGNAIGIEQFRPALRALFSREGFRAGTWGQELLEELPAHDYYVRKWGHSAMYLTDLEKILRALGRRVLVMSGLGTNGVVEGTARDAVTRGFDVAVLTDAVCAPDQQLHEGAMRSLGHLGRLLTTEEFVGILSTHGRG